MPFHLESLRGAPLMLHTRCTMDWDKTVRVGKNSGPILSRLWTKVHEIFGQHRRPFALFNAFGRLSCFSRYSPLRLDVVKTTNVKVFGPNVKERRPQLLCSRLLAQPTLHRLAKFGWVPFADLVCEAWRWSGMQILRRLGEISLPIWSRL